MDQASFVSASRSAAVPTVPTRQSLMAKIQSDPYWLSSNELLRILISPQPLTVCQPVEVTVIETQPSQPATESMEIDAMELDAETEQTVDLSVYQCPAFNMFDYSLPLCINPHQQARERSWFRTVDECWQRIDGTDIFWNDGLHSQVVMMCVKQLRKMFKLTLHAFRPASRGSCTRSFTANMPPYIWHQFIWNRLLPEEKLATPKSSPLEKAEIREMGRIAALFGAGSLAKVFPRTGGRMLIAPRGCVEMDFHPSQLDDPHKQFASVQVLSVHRRQYVAILQEFSDLPFSLAYVFDRDSRTRILDVDLKGKIGVIPKAVYSLDHGLKLSYSKDTNVLTVEFVVFGFNAAGTLISPQGDYSKQ